MHVQKGATHNVFDFYGDVVDPMMAFLKRHGVAPWGAEGRDETLARALFRFKQL